MSFFANAFSAIINAVRSIYRLVQRFIYGILSFKEHIVHWSKNTTFRRTGYSISRGRPLFERKNFTRHLNTVAEIFQGIYNEETDSITHHEFIGAEKLDSETKEVLKSAEEGLVVLR